MALLLPDPKRSDTNTVSSHNGRPDDGSVIEGVAAPNRNSPLLLTDPCSNATGGSDTTGPVCCVRRALIPNDSHHLGTGSMNSKLEDLRSIDTGAEHIR